MHGKPPNYSSSGVTGVLLAVALVVAVVTLCGAAHGLKGLLDALSWTH